MIILFGYAGSTDELKCQNEKFKSYKDIIAKIIFNDRLSKMSIHNFIINHKPKFTMQNYLCNQDGILWINCDGMRIKRKKTTKAV